MMQKKLIVFTLTAAFALPLSALADSSNFTFYGKADVSYDMVNTGDRKGINYGFSQNSGSSSTSSGFGTSPSILSLGLEYLF